MAPLKPVKKDGTGKRVQQILDCANRTYALLRDRTLVPASLEPELEAIIKRSFPLPSTTSLAEKVAAFDISGSQLWNAATNIIRDEENQQRDPCAKRKDTARLVVLLRTFAFLLVDAANHTSSRRLKDHDQCIRTFKIANKACRFCLDRGESELALKVLERSSEYVSKAEEDAPVVQLADESDGRHDEHQQTLRQLIAEYYLLRMTHAWKSGRFDVADHFFTKFSQREMVASASLAEKAADLFHEAGKSLSAAKQPENAIKWCERAITALDACEFEDLSQDAPELRLAIASTLVDMLLTAKNGNAGNRTRASDIVDQLGSAYGLGNRIAVSLMRFQILTNSLPVDLDQLSAVLQHLIRLAVLTDKSFKTIMQTIYKVKRYSVTCALSALQELICVRLLPDLAPDIAPDKVISERLEKAAVTCVLFATSQTETPPADATHELQMLLDTVYKRSESPFSPKATHAAQTLIWKTAGTSSPDVAEDWLKLLRHPMFDSAGQLNKARIGRKAIVTALTRNDFDAAREAFYQMPQAAQNEGITRYLAFKLALRSSDHELADESLQVVARHADKDPTYLYACVLEAQQSDVRYLAVAALQGLLDRQPPGIHLPSLLRCTARLLIGELEMRERSPDEVMHEIVKLFERAGANTKIFRQGTDDQWRAEIQWWSKNAYNLALRFCAEMHPGYLVNLLSVCTKFLECYPKDGGPMHQDDLVRRQALCHFLSTSALIVLARSSEEGAEYSLQYYTQARRQITAFMGLAKKLEAAHSKGFKDEEAKATAARVFELLKFDLECILKLQQWDQLDHAVQAFLNFNGGERWDSLADLALIVHEQASTVEVANSATARIPQLLERCINETWKRDKDITKMARWMRLTFTIYLQDDEGGLALKIVQQAAGVAQKGFEGQADPYPGTELEWLATMAFNKAVDALSSGDRGGSNEWIKAALELARYNGDNGALHANLTWKQQQAGARMKGKDL